MKSGFFAAITAPSNIDAFSIKGLYSNGYNISAILSIPVIVTEALQRAVEIETLLFCNRMCVREICRKECGCR